LRLLDDRGGILSNQSFNGPDAHLRMAINADMIRERLIAKGYREADEEHS